MIEIDGATGEGGGQVLRTSLTLSLLTRTAVHLVNVRAKRDQPGMRAQHVAAVKAAAQVGDAEFEGDFVGSRELTFKPRKLLTGSFRFDVGTAGSSLLVLQTVLPALLVAREPSAIILEGGTHNPMAPPFEFVNRVFLPVLNKMGAKVSAKLDRAGFYPLGGGKIRVEVTPAKDGRLTRLDLLTRGEIIRRRATAMVTDLPLHIVERELKIVKLELGWKGIELKSSDLGPCRGPGNALTLEVESEHVTELITGIGEKDKRAESVATAACAEMKRYLASNVPVGEHLADQLLLPMAMAGGGTFRTLAPTKHTTTQLDLLSRLFGVNSRAVAEKGESWKVDVGALTLPR